MKHKLGSYERKKKDLIRQIELCHSYKKQIYNTLQNLKEQCESGSIDTNVYSLKVNEFLRGRSYQDWCSMYDEHITECYQSIEYYDEKIKEITQGYDGKRNSFSMIFMLVGVFSLMFSILFFVQPTITGLIPYTAESTITFEDGYTKEGSDWMEIKGARVYERCLNVNSEIGFNSVGIMSKVTSASDNKGLRFNLYDDVDGEPSELLGSCKVKQYDDLWKTCSIKNLEQDKGGYWICASQPRGDSEKTYYTIAYQKGDSKKTALWTGENWQKLDRSSYTIKAEFIKNE